MSSTEKHDVRGHHKGRGSGNVCFLSSPPNPVKGLPAFLDFLAARLLELGRTTVA